MVKFDVSGPEDKKALAAGSGSPSSSASSADGGSLNGDRKRRRRNGKERSSKKRQHDGSVEIINGGHARTERRESLSKAARDPRDIPEPRKKHKKQHTTTKEPKEGGKITRSPSPVIDFDGLSRPSEPHPGPSSLFCVSAD